MTAAREALERLTRWRNKEEGWWYYTGSDAFNEDVLTLLSLLEWRPISEAPKDTTVIVRWHRMWNCEVSVWRNNGCLPGGLEWITATKDHQWPEEAFLPVWRRPSPAPAAPETDHDR